MRTIRECELHSAGARLNQREIANMRLIELFRCRLCEFLVKICAVVGVLLAGVGCGRHAPLPALEEFDSAAYLGVWHESARLPVFFQREGTLAMARYTPGDRDSRIGVENFAVSAEGQIVSSIRGVADAAEGEPAGRFTVRFPGIPSLVARFTGPNYHIFHLSEDGQHALVGNPSRRTLWILSRNVPVEPEELDALIGIADRAGFDVLRLLLAPWASTPVPELPEAEKSH